ncbi:MAG: eukaryotic-like serine/threonine-protein kinase [Pyrinomonadaceae bacterium]|jgi:serine/threonine-protein kinase|nr:eukaryotic-like serine/threonine-protein kinase [Pyrinomonadaceae bacterium]
MAESQDKTIEFVRKKDLILKRQLGQGACGLTVLLYDSIIDEYFVCKKYSPINEALRETLFNNFVREIKLLHILNHPNVVRVFNYYLYPEQFAGYILMEFVEGTDIEEYLVKHPEDINEIFTSVIEGFTHLEKHSILHRDIRPQNILVTKTGLVKIIDFGFGKQVFDSEDFGKSITLNWWCEPPSEFRNHIYDYHTEVYFVGKLFEKIILESQIDHFKHKTLLGRMCASDPSNRVALFSAVRKEILSDRFLDIDFTDDELETYRHFSDSLHSVTSKIEENAKYRADLDDIQTKLEDCYKKVMLEQFLPDNSLIMECFINGSYYYKRNIPFYVENLKDFLNLFRACSREKRNIILSNLQTRLDSVVRYDLSPSDSDDIPF